MTTTPDLNLPRAQWADHPRFPQQVLLVRSHASFRRFSRHLIELAKRGAPARHIGQGFHSLKAAMRGHEAYEEHKLYPYLEARFGIACQTMRDGHHALDAADQGVRRALEASANTTPTDALIDALERHDEVLHTHLEHEEDVVIPALLALSPDEFAFYYDNTIDTLIDRLKRAPRAS